MPSSSLVKVEVEVKVGVEVGVEVEEEGTTKRTIFKTRCLGEAA